MSIGVTLRTNKPNRFGVGVILGGIEVKFDKFGMVEVPDRQVAELVKAGLEIVDEADVEKYKEDASFNAVKEQQIADIDVHDANIKLKIQNEALKLKNVELGAENTDLCEKLGELRIKYSELETLFNENEAPQTTGVDEDKEASSLDDMSDDDLTALCKEVKYPKKEWDKLKGDKLKEYVKGKLK